jgi:SAM-dependent methyltransferase
VPEAARIEAPPLRSFLIAVLLVSAAALGYEILLMRMLSIVQWHHFAWMVISLALLGYGASGTAIALARHWLQPRLAAAFATSALLFSVSMAACWALAQRVPFNALEVVWAPRQLLLLAALYLLFMIPFFFAASCIGLIFTFRGHRAPRIYLLDLLGAGSGAVGIIALLFLLDAPRALAVLALLPAGAVLLARPGPWLRFTAVTWAALLLGALPAGLLDLRPSPFKSLSTTLETVGAEVRHESSSPLGRLTVVANRQVPFRHAPGLGLATRNIPPEQLAVFVDGEGMSAITRWDGSGPPPAYLGDLTSALPYHVPLSAPVGAASAATGGSVTDNRTVGPEGPPTSGMRVLVLGAGTGGDVLQALLHGAASVDAVELDPAVIALVRERYADFAGNLYADPRVTLHVGEARGFARRNSARFDLVQIGLLDAFAVSGSGVQTLNENYLYTTEAIRDYLRLLRPGGSLAITRWLKIPPRDSLKLVNTVIHTLERNGVETPGAHLAMIRGWNTVTLLVRNEPFEPNEGAAIRRFAADRAFDVVHTPGMAHAEANRYNRLERAWFHDGVTALLGPEAGRFVARYKFDIAAATDDRPYFFNFFRWRTFREALQLRDRGGAALIEWGYLVPAATLVQAVLAGGLLILLPLALARRPASPGAGRSAGPYFFLLGLAFLFVEIAFIQKLTLFLSHPLYAVAVVLTGFLVFAGIGSGLSEPLARRAAARGYSATRLAVAGIVALALVYLLALPALFAQAMALGDLARIGLALATIAPLALCMGMPFPLGLAATAGRAPDFLPWAWGINGFASVISAALATLLAIEFGFTAVVLLALALYVLAAWLAPDSGQATVSRAPTQRL